VGLGGVGPGHGPLLQLHIPDARPAGDRRLSGPGWREPWLCSSTFQMPVLLSRVAINTTRTASPAVVQSLYKALSTSAATAAAPVSGNNAIIITIYSLQDIRIKSTNISISSADKIRQPRTPSLTNSKKGKGIPILDYRA